MNCLLQTEKKQNKVLIVVTEGKQLKTFTKSTLSCADPESFVRGGPYLMFFLVGEGIEDPNTTINGPSSAHQQNAMPLNGVLLACR